MKITGENPFQVPKESFAISPCSNNYMVQYSADGEHYTSYASATTANQTLIVRNAAANMFWRLSGNTEELHVQF